MKRMLLLVTTISLALEPVRTGTLLSALTLGTPHFTLIEPRSNWGSANTGTRLVCEAVSQTTPTAPADLTMRIVYDLGNLSAGQSKTVKVEYERVWNVRMARVFSWAGAKVASALTLTLIHERPRR